jgi:hypothetical protein
MAVCRRFARPASLAVLEFANGSVVEPAGDAHLWSRPERTRASAGHAGADPRLTCSCRTSPISPVSTPRSRWRWAKTRVALGTGVGGGIVVEGRILTGLNRIGGEWGHNPLPWATENERPGSRCYCGKFGCIETFLSGAGLVREYFSLSQKELLAEQIAEAEQSGEPDAVQSLATYQDRLARSLAALVNVLDADVIVLGGGISNINSLYGRLTELIGQYAFSDQIKTKVVRAAHGDSSGVRGAAWLWPINKP